MALINVTPFKESISLPVHTFGEFGFTFTTSDTTEWDELLGSATLTGIGGSKIRFINDSGYTFLISNVNTNILDFTFKFRKPNDQNFEFAIGFNSGLTTRIRRNSGSTDFFRVENGFGTNIYNTSTVPNDNDIIRIRHEGTGTQFTGTVFINGNQVGTQIYNGSPYTVGLRAGVSNAAGVFIAIPGLGIEDFKITEQSA